jgi:arabinose-5-phosphate isomerase
MEMRQFKAENFALYHPGGALGRKLMGRVHHVMTTHVPRVAANASFREVVCEMTDKHLGMTMVYDEQSEEKCLGIITDGDIRRAIQKYNDVHMTAGEIMTPSYKHIAKDALLTDALAVMDTYNITTLAVTETDETTEIIGIISIHHIIDFK